MNSDLNVLLLLYLEGSLIRVAVSVPDGLNKFHDWEYWGELDVSKQWKELLPPHIKDGEILEIIQIFDIIKTTTHASTTDTLHTLVDELESSGVAPKKWAGDEESKLSHRDFKSIGELYEWLIDDFETIEDVIDYLTAGNTVVFMYRNDYLTCSCKRELFTTHKMKFTISNMKFAINFSCGLADDFISKIIALDGDSDDVNASIVSKFKKVQE